MKDAKDRERETFPLLVARNPSSSLARFAESRAAAGSQGTGAKSGAALLWGVLAR